MHVQRGLAGVMAALVMCASAPRASAADATAVTRGHDIVAGACARCHAIEATGASTHPQAPPFRDVAGRYPPEELEEALAEGIVSGHPDMPQFEFEPAEIDAIIAYLNHLRAAPKPSGP